MNPTSSQYKISYYSLYSSHYILTFFILEHSPNPLKHHNPWFRFLKGFHIVSFLLLQPISSTTLINHMKKMYNIRTTGRDRNILIRIQRLWVFWFFFFFKKRKQYLTNLLAAASFLDLTLHYTILFWVVITNSQPTKARLSTLMLSTFPVPTSFW